MNHKIRVLKFAIVGVANTALDFCVFLLLFRALDWGIIPSNIVAYLLAVTNSYVFNRIWTFKSRAIRPISFLSYSKFVAVSSVGLAVGTITIYLLKSVMFVEMAKLLSTFATLIWNYLGTRFWVFNERDENA